MAWQTKRRLLSPLMSLILLCIAFFAIWTFGPQLSIAAHTPLSSALSRATLSSLFILTWFFSLLPHSFIRKMALPYQSSHQTQQAMHLLTQQFQGAIHFLKKTTTTANINQQRKNLYDLPWYLFIGPPKSGKSSLLANAGLSFILAKKPVKPDQLRSTELCDWWVSREAVFLDTTGAFCPIAKRQTYYKALFSHLLQLIKHEGKNRLNGIVLVLDLPTLNQLTRVKQQYLYANIRANLALIKKQLHVDLPVYLTCNQCDRLVGFQEFFDDLGQEEQQQIWGITLPGSQLMRAGELLKHVSKELAALLMRLHERLLWRLHHEHNQQKRLIIKDFPIQLEMLTTQITKTVKALFGSKTPCWLRGIYLTSATTKNQTKEDYILPTIKQNLQIPELANADQTTQHYDRSNALFAKHFLQRLLSHDHDLVMNYNQTDLAKTWIRRGAVLCAAMIIITFALSWSVTLKQHVSQIDHSEKALASYQTLVNVSQATEATLDNPTLDSIRQTLQVISPTLNASKLAMQSLNDTQQHWINHLFHQDYKNRYGETQALYHNTLDHLFTPIMTSLVKATLEDEIKQPGIDFYSTLEVYLMLGEPKHLSRDFVKRWLIARWAQLYPHDPLMQDRLRIYTEDWLTHTIKPIDLDETLLTNVKQKMQTRAKVKTQEAKANYV